MNQIQREFDQRTLDILAKKEEEYEFRSFNARGGFYIPTFF